MPSAQYIDDIRNLTNRKVLWILFFLILTLVSGVSYGQELEQTPGIDAMVGLNAEVSADRSRDIVNVGLWMVDRNILTHAGLYDIKPKNAGGSYGVDIGMGYCLAGYYLWPYVEAGMKLGAGAGLTSFNAEFYPKVGIAIPISEQMLVYIGYLYSFSTQGIHQDYSAGSVGFVWAIR